MRTTHRAPSASSRGSRLAPRPSAPRGRSRPDAVLSSPSDLTESDPADPERAQRPRAARQRHEVPDAGLEDEAERVEQPLHLALGLAVADLDALLLPHRPRQRGEVGDRLLPREPTRARRGGSAPHPHGAAAQLGRQGGVDLELGGGQHGAEAELGRGAGQARQGQRLGLLGREPGEPGAVAVDEPHAAAGSGLRVDRHAGARQGLDVPVDRAHRHLELLGQAARRHLAVGLEEQQELHQPARTHGVDRRPAP